MYNVSGGHKKYFGKTQKRKLMKTRRDSAEVHVECRVCVFVIDGKDHDPRKVTMMIAWQDQKLNSISGIKI
jgi:heterodisulfide reductase subunit B